MIIEKFSKKFNVHYYEINNSGTSTPITILNYLEECAIAHSESVGLGIHKLMADGMGWVLKKWSLHIDRYPERNEEIIVETWPSSFERFYAERQFVLKDEGGNIIGKAASLWIFVDINKRRPQRIPEYFGEKYGIDSKRVLDEPFSELVKPDEPEIIKKFEIRRSDVDTNNHVNNTRYVDWMLEAIPQEVYQECIASDLEIEYKKETGYGFSINSCCREQGRNEAGIQYNHCIFDSESGTELALGKTRWVLK